MSESRLINDPLLRLAIERAGSEALLAKALGISRGMVYRWKKIPERFAVKCEELYAIPREKIAPEMFKGLRISRAR